jgi:hypothetical protein
MTTQVLDAAQRPVIDIGSLAEEGVWSRPRKQVLLLCALAIALDGLDNQILGFAIPSMIKEWSGTRGDFAPALALGFVGMTIGTPIGGIVGDWLGRKVALIASVFLFGHRHRARSGRSQPLSVSGRFRTRRCASGGDRADRRCQSAFKIGSDAILVQLRLFCTD